MFSTPRLTPRSAGGGGGGHWCLTGGQQINIYCVHIPRSFPPHVSGNLHGPCTAHIPAPPLGEYIHTDSLLMRLISLVMVMDQWAIISCIAVKNQTWTHGSVGWTLVQRLRLWPSVHPTLPAMWAPFLRCWPTVTVDDWTLIIMMNELAQR